MTTIRTGNARLFKLADFLDTLKRRQFNFRSWVSEKDEKGCGTVCCAVGWTPRVFPKLVRWVDGSVHTDKAAYALGSAMDLFGMDETEVRKTFIARGYDTTNSGLPENATAQRVAKHIRKVVAKRKAKA